MRKNNMRINKRTATIIITGLLMISPLLASKVWATPQEVINMPFNYQCATRS